jgi:hypothetical protein
VQSIGKEVTHSGSQQLHAQLASNGSATTGELNMAAEPRRIILAVDATAASENAVTWAIDNFLKQGDHVLVLNAQPYGMADGIPNVDFAGGGEYAVPEMPSEADDKLTTELAMKTVDGYMKQIAAKKDCLRGRDCPR